MTEPQMNDETTVSSEDSNKKTRKSSLRRLFIKGAVVSIGAVVAKEITQKAAAAEITQDKQLVPSGSLNGVVQVQFTQTQPKIEDLQNILAQIVKLNGCFTCGLAGIDLRFRLGGLKKLDIKSQVPSITNLETRF